MVFEFISEGTKGQIPKLIKFSETALKGFYNLAFGDKNLETGDIGDNVVSNNGDSEKVLATVVSAVFTFTDLNKDVWVYATEITKHLPEAENKTWHGHPVWFLEGKTR